MGKKPTWKSIIRMAFSMKGDSRLRPADIIRAREQRSLFDQEIKDRHAKSAQDSGDD